MKKTNKDKAGSVGTETQEGEAAKKDEKDFSVGEIKRMFAQLSPLQKARTEIKLRGTTDLIVHAWSAKALAEMLKRMQMSQSEKKAAKADREKRDPVADFMGTMYLSNQRTITKKFARAALRKGVDWSLSRSEREAKPNLAGKHYFPSIAFKRALADAAAFAGGIPVKWVMGAILIPPEMIEIDFEELAMREDAVKVGPKRDSDLRYRAAYVNWPCKIPVEFRTDLLNASQLVTLFQNAGHSIGIGEWRTQRSGRFGSFEVVL